jgi:DNA-binding response OmpR family regulator
LENLILIPSACQVAKPSIYVIIPPKEEGLGFMAKRILLVEDDPAVLRAVSYMLGKEGYEVLTASNGLDGLTKAKGESPDLLILDVMLPGIDGFEICHRLRAEPQTAQLPILMLSAKGQAADKSMGLQVGANEYLTKPVERLVLLGKIEALLGAKK